MPNKTVISNFSTIEESNTLIHDTRSVSKVFKNVFSKLTEPLLIKLLKPPNKYKLKSVIQYYSSFVITVDFCLTFGLTFDTTEHEILLQKLNVLDSQRKLYSDLDPIFLTEYFFLILKLSSQNLEKLILGYHKNLSYVPFCF